MAETRPRAGLLAGEERARRSDMVGDGGAGVMGGTKLRGFTGEEENSAKFIVGNVFR